ncbi:MAG TPA: hypothetical protein VGS19_22350 [Streptosporangiaceae bacterium]|nr:hypothetical protein [Streptosporangiaceae bacterium]
MNTNQRGGDRRAGDRSSTVGTLSEQVPGWFVGRLPGGWFSGPPDVMVDREEISVIGSLPLGRPERVDVGTQPGGSEAGASREPESEDAADEAVALGRIRRFREETRDARVAIAREAEALFGRKVSWGVVCAGQKVMFTTLSVPVMTRLRQPERLVLDTLVDAGVARSRSEALAWCARLVGQHEDSWLADLRAALRHVAEVRAQGPRS